MAKSGQAPATQVVACFVIYRGEEISYQGSFQVSEYLNVHTFPSNDGGEFEFRHHYKGEKSFVKLSYSKDGAKQSRIDLTIPINRSKVKWKKDALGSEHDVHYRCLFENNRMSKESKKLQRNAAIQRQKRQPSEPNIFYGEHKDKDA